MGLLSKLIFGANIEFDKENQTIKVDDVEFVCKNNDIEEDANIADLDKRLDELELSLNGIKEQLAELRNEQEEAQKRDDMHTAYINNNTSTLEKIAVIVAKLDEKQTELVEKLKGSKKLKGLLLD